MAQLRSKQILLGAAGNLLVGGAGGKGVELAIGGANTFLMGGTSLAYSGITVTVSGDVSGTAAVTAGTAAVAVVLPTINATPGTFAGITTNDKGLVTGSVALTTLDDYGIIDSQTKVASDAAYAAKATTLAGYGISDAVNTASLNVASGVATLGSDGKLLASQVPAIPLGNTFVDASEAAMLAEAANVGDVSVRTDINESFILKTAPASTLANWVQLLSPSGSTTLTGDIAGTGTGSITTTLATVNATVGTFAGITVTAKGLVTEAVALTSLADYGILDTFFTQADADALYLTEALGDARYVQISAAFTKAIADGLYLTQTLGDARYVQTTAAFTQALADPLYVHVDDAFTQAIADGLYLTEATGDTRYVLTSAAFTQTLADARYVQITDAFTQTEADGLYLTQTSGDARYVQISAAFTQALADPLYVHVADAFTQAIADTLYAPIGETGPVEADHEFTVVTGGANATFTAFFAAAPIANSVSVYFNGLKLRTTGYTISGDDLTLVDSVNGYGTDPDDVISAHYQHA